MDDADGMETRRLEQGLRRRIIERERRGMEIRLHSGEVVVTVELIHEGGALQRCRVDGTDHAIDVLHSANQTVVALVDGRPVRASVARDGDSISVGLGGVVYRFTAGDRADPGGSGRRPGTGRATAPMPGRVLNILVGEGDPVEVGQPLVLLEAMKMELTVTADVDGTVAAVHVAPGDMVEGAQLLLELGQPPALFGDFPAQSFGVVAHGCGGRNARAVPAASPCAAGAPSHEREAPACPFSRPGSARAISAAARGKDGARPPSADGRR